MIFPEFLYQLSERDQQTTWLDPVVSFVRVAGGLTVLTSTFTVPVGRMLLLTSACVFGLPGAGQSCNGVRVEVRPRDAALAVVIARWVPVTLPSPVTNPITINFSGQVIVPADWTVVSLGDFTFAAANNTLDASLTGILLPIGNVQRV